MDNEEKTMWHCFDQRAAAHIRRDDFVSDHERPGVTGMRAEQRSA